MRVPTRTERFAAEALGTFLLVFIGAGTGTAAALIAHKSGLLSGTADLALIAFAHGLALFIIVMIIGKVSGAHVNPAVTIGLAAARRLAWEDVPAYIGGQVIGAVVGAAAILIVYGKVGATIGHLGAPALAPGINIWQGLAIEGIGAGILMLAIIGTAVDTRAPAGWAGLAIGFSLAAIIMVIGTATGGSVNPARAFGPDFIDIFYGVNVDWGAYIVSYLVGPILGMIGAAFLYTYITALPSAPAEKPSDQSDEIPVDTNKGAGASI